MDSRVNDGVEIVEGNEIKAELVIRMLNAVNWHKDEKIERLKGYIGFIEIKIDNEVNELIRLQDYLKEVEENEIRI